MNSNPFIVPICFFVLAIAIGGCGSKNNKLFSKLPSSQSGIHFSNDIRDTDSTNSLINEYGYMGGGVGVGDFNNDGLKDIVFSANQVSSRIYINKGNNGGGGGAGGAGGAAGGG